MNLPSDGLTRVEYEIAHVGSLRMYRKRKTDIERVVIAMKYDLGWPISDIAFATGRSDTTIRNIIKRIKEDVKRDFLKNTR